MRPGSGDGAKEAQRRAAREAQRRERSQTSTLRRAERQREAALAEWERQNRERHDRLLRRAAARIGRIHLASALGQWKEWSGQPGNSSAARACNDAS